MKKYISKFKYVLIFLIASFALFITGIFSHVIQYGEMNVIDKDTDTYSGFSNRELWIDENDELIQNLTSNSGLIHSISLKYHVDQFTDDLLINIELYNAENDELIQTWSEAGENIAADGFSEYLIDQDKVQKNDRYYLRVTANQATNVLCCSEADSLQKCIFTINGEEQGGDLIIRSRSNVYVTATLYWGYVYCSLITGLVMLVIDKRRKISEKISGIVSYVQSHVKQIVITAVEIAVIALLSFGLEHVYTMYHMSVGHQVSSFNPYKYLFVFVTLTSFFLLFKYRKTLVEKPERMFLVIFMLLGLFMVVIMPAEAEISWDESIHFWKAVSVSHAWNGQANAAESYLYWHSGIGGYGIPSLVDTLHARQNSMQVMYEAGGTETIGLSVLSSLNAICYLPSACGLIIGRVLHLSLKNSYYLGAAMNMVLYVTLVYFGMKKLKSGKMILLVIATLPTAMFLGAVYSLDSWITGFTILTMCYLIGILQSKEKVSSMDLCIMVGAFCLGLLAKTIYFSLFFLFLFIPHKQFESEKQCLYFRITTVSMGLTYLLAMVLDAKYLIPVMILMWLFVYAVYRLIMLIPKKRRKAVLISGTVIALIMFVAAVYVLLPIIVGQGDARGGNTVNSGEQVKYVLNHPFAYLQILIGYLVNNYLNPTQGLKVIFGTFGYLGESSFAYLSMLLVLFVIVFDKNEFDLWHGYLKMKISVLITDLATIVLIATALYVSFTPVAHTMINGCQPRYLIPLLFGTGITIGSNKLSNKISKKTLNTVVFVLCVVLLLANVWQLTVCKYA